MQTRHLIALTLTLGVLIGLVFYSISLVGATNQEPVKKELIKNVPEIKSCVSSIRVISAKIKNPERPNAALVVELENTSDIGIIAISIDSKTEKETYSVIRNTFGSDKPLAIIEPHSADSVRLELANIRPGAQIEIGSVTYMDGTEEGCSASVESMHQSKLSHEKEAKSKKEPK
jgi:hypothetical protein